MFFFNCRPQVVRVLITSWQITSFILRDQEEEENHVIVQSNKVSLMKKKKKLYMLLCIGVSTSVLNFWKHAANYCWHRFRYMRYVFNKTKKLAKHQTHALSISLGGEYVTIIESGWVWCEKICRSRWITAEFFTYSKTQFNFCFIIH